MDKKHLFVSLGIAAGGIYGIFADNIGVGIAVGFIMGISFHSLYEKFRENIHSKK